MKKLLILPIFIVITLTIYAQEPTNPAARSHYKSVLSSFEKIKLIPLPEQIKKYENELLKTQEKINFIKQYEPTFDVSSLQKTQDNLYSKVTETKSESNSSRANYIATKNELITLFKTPDLIYQPAASESYKKTFTAYCESVNNFLSNDGKNKTSNAISQNPSLEKDVFEYGNSDYPTILSNLENNLKSATDDQSPFQNYFKLLHYQKYWELATTIFSNSEYKTYLEQTNIVINKIGSIDQVLLKKDQNYMMAVKNKKMPEAKFINTDLQKSFETNFYEYCKQFSWDDKIIKINLLTNEWGVIRDKLTNKIIKRYQSAAIATYKNGKYVVYDIVNLYQDYDGTTYSKTYCGHDFYGPEEILKENIK